MKYYCKNCGTQLTVGDGLDTRDYFEDGLFCPFNITHGEMESIPDYETPKQYEKRTGKAYPDNGLVWYRMFFTHIPHGYYNWVIRTYSDAKRARDYCKGKYQTAIVIADPPVPPPNNWRPE